jgi:hypothetical protein
LRPYIRESTASWPGRWSAASATIRCRIVSASLDPPRCRTGDSNSSTLLGDGRDRLKQPQIIVENGFSPTAVTDEADMRRPSIKIEQRDRLRPRTRPEDMGLAANATVFQLHRPSRA